MTGIVILNYKGIDDTIACIESIEQNVPKTDRILIVVDNASGKEEETRLRIYCSDKAEFIETGDNIGYAAGNNVGIRKATELGCNHVCILNNDTLVTTDFLNPCIKYLDTRKEVAFAGPVLLQNKPYPLSRTF